MRSVDNFRTVEECIIEWLQKDLSRTEEYLNVALEVYRSEFDLERLLHSLECITTAKGNTFELVDSAEVDQKSLDKRLEEDPSPAWEKVLQVLT